MQVVHPSLELAQSAGIEQATPQAGGVLHTPPIHVVQPSFAFAQSAGIVHLTPQAGGGVTVGVAQEPEAA